MKSILTLAGCAVALLFAGCTTQKAQDPVAPAEPSKAAVAAKPAKTVVDLDDTQTLIGESYAALNKQLGTPVETVAQTGDATARKRSNTPASATYSQTKRQDIVGEVFYTKAGSRTLSVPNPPRHYENVKVVKALFNDEGVTTNAVVTTIDRLLTTCSVCSERTPCVQHDCKDGKCVCPAPCGCETCDKAKCQKMGCIPGEPCKCCPPAPAE